MKQYSNDTLKRIILALIICVVFPCTVIPQSSITLWSFGDSIALGALIPTPYPQRVADRFGYTLHNQAISNSMVADTGSVVYGHTPSSTDISTLAFGANDERTYLTDYLDPNQNKVSPADWVAYYRSGLGALAIWLTGAARKATDSSHTYSGTWADNTAHHAGIGRMSSTPGSTVEWDRTGPVVLIGVATTDGGDGTFTVSIDGAGQGTFHNYETRPIQTRIGSTYGPKYMAFSTSAGSHHVVLTVVSGTVYFDWEAGTAGTSKVFVVTTIRQSANGYAYNHGSDENVAQYNTAARSLVTELQGYGLPVSLVNATDYVDNLDGLEGLSVASDILSGDGVAGHGIHPNQSGTDLIAQAVIDQISLQKRPPVIVPLSLLNGWTAYGSSYAVPGCAIVSGWVKCQGLVKGGTVNATIANVPESMRPGTTHVFLAETYYGAQTFCRVDVSTDGSIRQTDGISNTWISLDGIFYPTGN